MLSKTIVYLITGFIEAGKTKFIQDMLDNPRFANGKKTLLILCEDGINSYEVERFAVSDVDICYVDSQEALTQQLLLNEVNRTGAERIICEYNGMWSLDMFYSSLPDNWTLYQAFFIADSTNILFYNANLRQLVYDKLSRCTISIFNRVGLDSDITLYHKLVRGISSRAKIVFEYLDGSVLSDPIEDKLPYDLSKDTVAIFDVDYAWWYRALNEDRKVHESKTYRFKAYLPSGSTNGQSTVAGRHVMVCCPADLQFQYFICSGMGDLEPCWAELKAYLLPDGSYPPKFEVLEYTRVEEPDCPIATF